MKKFLAAVVTVGLLASAGSALAYTLTDGTDVGDADEYIVSAELANSGDETELGWVRDELGDDSVVLSAKYDDVLTDWYATDEVGIFAYNLLTSPEYFLIKLGTGSEGDTHFLFENVDAATWAVIDLWGYLEYLGIDGDDYDNDDFVALLDKVSHLDEFNGTPVPEPSTLLMLGAGLLGLGLYGRRRVQK